MNPTYLLDSGISHRIDELLRRLGLLPPQPKLAIAWVPRRPAPPQQAMR